MDTFDLSFLLLNDKAQDFPFEKCTCICLKSDRDIKAWGPESRLIGDIVVGAWKRKAKKFLSELQACYEIEPELKINEKKINKLFRQYKNIGKDTWKIVEKKVRKILDATTERSIKYFIGQAKKQKKSKKAEEEVFDPTITYDAFIAEITGDHIASFMARYPDAILHPEIERLSTYLRVSDEAGPLDKYYVKERLDAIQHKGDAYFEGMTDVEVGKAWTATGVELAYRNNVAEYMIVAQVDSPNKPCPVCRALHGKSFSVVQAKKNVDHLMVLKGTEDFAKEAPFPRIDDLKNLSREEMHARGELPSFHSSCRCDVVFSWGGEIPVAQRYKPEPTKAKILKFIPAKNKADATKYAKEQLGMQQVDFGKLDMEVINEMNKTVREMYDEYPAMQGELKFLGSEQRLFAIRDQNALKEKRKYWKNLGFSQEEIGKMDLMKSVRSENKIKGYFPKREFAISLGKSFGDLRGVAFNEDWGGNDKSGRHAPLFVKGKFIDVSEWKKVDVFKAEMRRLKDNKWLVSGNMHGALLHEFGHQIGFTLNQENPEMIAQIEKYRKEKNKSYFDNIIGMTDNLSRYSIETPNPNEEFLAECWSEYKGSLDYNKKPREISSFVGKLLNGALRELEK
jgi:hypothetical protein